MGKGDQDRTLKTVHQIPCSLNASNMNTAWPDWYLLDLKYLFQNEDIETGIVPIGNPKNYTQP